MSKAAELASLIGNINAGGGGVNRNLMINGAMNVAQRGTSVASLVDTSGYKTCDRWFFNVYSGTFTQSQSSDSPDGFGNSIKLDCTAAETPGAADQTALYQHMEGQNLQAIKKGTSEAKPLVASFWVKSTVTGTAVCELVDNDSAHRTNSQSYTINSANTWEYKTVTFPPDTGGSTMDDDNASSMYFAFWLVAGANYKSGSLQTSWGAINNGNRAVGQTINIGSSTDNNFYLTGVQLEIGQNPTEFEHEPFETTLDKCQRYYQKSYDYARAPGYSASSTSSHTRMFINNRNPGFGHAYAPFKKRMRAVPTVTHYNPYDGTINEISNYDATPGDNAGSNVSRIGEEGYTVYVNSTSLGHFIAYHFTAEAEL
tara:strand:+ start:2169 stop:3278 length:1110 start_codon:yes stop_codon:yes gene_type:complete